MKKILILSLVHLTIFSNSQLKNMKIFKHLFVFGLLLLTGCNKQPTKISGVAETIEVSYINWACNCADFIETKFYKHNSNYEVKAEDCIFLEPSNKNHQIPDDYFDKNHFEYYLKLNGQFYKDKGVPDSYEHKTPEEYTTDKAKVFRYDSFELIKK